MNCDVCNSDDINQQLYYFEYIVEYLCHTATDSHISIMDESDISYTSRNLLHQNKLNYDTKVCKKCLEKYIFNEHQKNIRLCVESAHKNAELIAKKSRLKINKILKNVANELKKDIKNNGLDKNSK